jgi:hypothetical protein
MLARIATHSRQLPEGWVSIGTLFYLMLIICPFLSACVLYYRSSFSQPPTHTAQ